MDKMRWMYFWQSRARHLGDLAKVEADLQELHRDVEDFADMFESRLIASEHGLETGSEPNEMDEN